MIHRVDPPVHTSRKGNVEKAVDKGKNKEGRQLSSKRKAPAIVASKAKGQSKAEGRRRARADSNTSFIGHVKFIASTAKPKQELIDRLRQRNETMLRISEVRRSPNDNHDDIDMSKGTKEITSQQLKQNEDKDKGQINKSRMNFIGQLKQMAAAQSEKMQLNRVAVSDSKCKVIKNTSMCKGRTFIGRMEPRTMGEAQVHGSNRSEHRSTNSTSSARYRGSSTLRAVLADAAIARLLQKVMPT